MRDLLIILEARVGECWRQQLERGQAAWPAIRSRPPDEPFRSRSYGQGISGKEVLLYIVAKNVEEALKLVTHGRIDQSVVGAWAGLCFNLFRVSIQRDPERCVALLKKRTVTDEPDWITRLEGPAQAAAELVA